MATSEDVQAANEEPVIPGWIGPDTRSFHRRHKPWYKRREFRRIFVIGLTITLTLAIAVALLVSGR